MPGYTVLNAPFTDGQTLSAATVNSIEAGVEGTSAELDAHIATPITYTKRIMQVLVNSGATTVSSSGLVAPTLSGTLAAVAQGVGPTINHATTAVIGNAAGVLSSFSVVQRRWAPHGSFAVRTNGVANVRLWVGFMSASMDALSLPTTQSVAIFRFDTGAGDATWKAVTSSSTANTVTDTTVAVADATAYQLRVSMTVGGEVRFYVDGVLRATHAANVPASTTNLGYGVRAVALAAAVANVAWTAIGVEYA